VSDDEIDQDADRLRRLHERLAATAERPVDPETSTWLGEAEAVVADVADDPAPPDAVIQRRVEQADELLANVDTTGDPVADEHVAAARELIDALLGEYGDRDQQ
jgi:hypothetical protein